MAKPKDGPALFELLRNSRRDRVVEQRETAGVADRDEPSPSLAPAPGIPRKTPPAAVPRDSGEAVRRGRMQTEEELCDVSGGRIRFSLTQKGATIALVVAVLVVGGVGYVGYRLGEERGKEKGRLAVQERVLDEIDQARLAPPTRNLFDGIGDDPTVATDSGGEPRRMEPALVAGDMYQASSVPWVSGHNYIVVQDFKSDARSDAIRAREFLEVNGVQTAIVELERSETYKYRLITVTGFNLDDAVQEKLAEEHLDKVRRIGQAYSEGGGRYDFQSAYFKKLTGDRW